MSFQIAIPSYNRPEVIKQKTLSYLDSEGFTSSEITIFLHTDTQAALYDLSGYNVVITNATSLAKQREFIRNYYPEGTRVVSLDDDVRRIKFLKPLPLRIFIERMFEITESHSLTLWGLYPVCQTNMFFCKERIQIGLTHIPAGFFGYITKHDMVYPDVSSKEELWATLYRYCVDGAVVRYDGACIDALRYGKGGLTTYRTILMEEEHSKAIQLLYPNLCSYRLKPNGHPDLRLKRMKNAIQSLYPDVQTQTLEHTSALVSSDETTDVPV